MKALLFVLLAFVLFVVSPALAEPSVLPNQVLLCALPDGLGHCHSVFLEPGMRQNPVPKLPPAIAGKVNSVYVGSDVVVHVFAKVDFRDWMFPVSQNTRDLGNDLTASLIVTRKTKDNPEWGDLVGVFVTRWDSEWKKDKKLILCPVLGEQLQAENRCSLEKALLDEYPAGVVDGKLTLLGLAEAELFENANFSGRRVPLPGLSGKSEFEFYVVFHPLDWRPLSMVVRYSGNKRVNRVQVHLPAQVARPEATKHRPPPQAPKQGITPGKLALPPSSSLALQYDKNIRGGDYKNFDLPEPRPELCRDACREERRCRAFTYVKPGFQGKKARCWLKEKVSPPQPAPCCVSGVKP